MTQGQIDELIGMTTAEADQKLKFWYACGFHEIDSDEADIVYENASGTERIGLNIQDGETVFDPDIVTDAFIL